MYIKDYNLNLLYFGNKTADMSVQLSVFVGHLTDSSNFVDYPWSCMVMYNYVWWCKCNVCSRITCLHLPLASKWIHVGTERGNVHVVNIETFALSGYVINWNKAIEV